MAELEEDKKLTPKQAFFCKEYLVDLNATQAAIRAGYAVKTATSIGCENLSKPNIAKQIAKLKALRAEQTQINAAYMLKLLSDIVETDLTEAIRITREEMQALPKEIRRLVTHVKREVIDPEELSEDLDEAHDPLDFEKYDTGQRLEVFTLSFIDKKSVIEMLNRHVGFYEQDNAQKSKLNLSTSEPEVSEISITIKKTDK